MNLQNLTADEDCIKTSAVAIQSIFWLDGTKKSNKGKEKFLEREEGQGVEDAVYINDFLLIWLLFLSKIGCILYLIFLIIRI